MGSSYAYRTEHASVLCATRLVADGRYCGNFVAVTTASDGHRDIHERTCPGWHSTLAHALAHARAMAEAIYPPISGSVQQSGWLPPRLTSCALQMSA